MTYDDESWKDDALCAEWYEQYRYDLVAGRMTGEQFDDVNIFFPERGDNRKIAEAKMWCGRCPVKRECLEYALANHEKHGIWGGLSEKERRHARKERRRGLTVVRTEAS